MANAPTQKQESIPLTAKQRKRIIERSTLMIDALSDIAVEIVADFVGKSDCTTANTIMLHQPEIIAIKALEQASRKLLQSQKIPSGASLH